MLKSILNIVFGKEPEIFDEKGRVSHNLPKKKWEAWHNRTKLDPEYNWRNHTGMNGGANPSKKK